MPHLTLEYSANLDSRSDLQRACERLLETVLSTGLFEIGAVRVRAVRCERYAIADQLAENSFADLSVRIGAGRSAEQKQLIADALMAAMEAHFQPLFQTPNFALSLEIREIDPDLSRKRNAMHDRLRNATQ